jgi:nitroreductase
MSENDHAAKIVSTVIRARRSTRHFTGAVPPIEDMNEILQSAELAPFGGATGIPLREIRKVFVFSQGTQSMNRARELLMGQLKRNSRKIRIVLFCLPFLKKKMLPFSRRIGALAKEGIPGLREAAYYVIIAEKKGFPPVEKQSIAHAMQNMWLSATARGLGFELISATGIMSKNEDFMELLGLKSGDYVIDGCVIGVPKTDPVPRQEYRTEDFVTWLK